MSTTSHVEHLYDETFEAVYQGLNDLAKNDPRWARNHIRGTLKSLYQWQGNDWEGRGAVGDARIAASIAAHEALLAELDQEETAGKGRDHAALRGRGQRVPRSARPGGHRVTRHI